MAQPSTVRLADYLALRKVPWTPAYVGFLVFVIIIFSFLLDLGTVAMAIAILGLVLGRSRVRWPLPSRLLLIYFFWAAISVVLNQETSDPTPLMNLGKVMLVFLVAINVLSHPLALRLFLLLYLACFTLFPVRGTIINYYIYDVTYRNDFGWIHEFRNANDMAAFTLLGLAIAAGFLHKDVPRVLRIGALLACFVFPFVILVMQSRAVFIGMSLFVVLAAITAPRRRMRTILALATIAATIVAVAPSKVWERVDRLKYGASLETIEKMDPEGSAAERWEIFETGFRIIKDHPVLGIGIGRYAQANRAYNPELGTKSIHSMYLQVLAETGVPGFLLYISFMAIVIMGARRSRKYARALKDSADWRRLQLLEFGLYGFLVAGLFGAYGYLTILYVYLAGLFAQSEVLSASLATPSASGSVPAPVNAAL